jgi:signal transduction histidine kinase
VPRPGGGSWLVVPAGEAWLLWLEDATPRTWTQGERTALTLAGSALARRHGGARWAEQLAGAGRRGRLDETARLVGRLAHDYGNVLTGILGFTELSMAQPAANTPALNSYLKEVHRAAQNGAVLTQQLRLFCLRQPVTPRPCPLGVVLGAEVVRIQGLGDPVPDVRLTVPPELPRLAIDAEQLRQVLATLLDNAREALAGPASSASRPPPSRSPRPTPST